MTFTLTIELGNEGMRSKDDIRWALERLVERFHTPTTGLAKDQNPIRDRNGNTVGHWEVTP